MLILCLKLIGSLSVQCKVCHIQSNLYTAYASLLEASVSVNRCIILLLLLLIIFRAVLNLLFALFSKIMRLIIITQFVAFFGELMYRSWEQKLIFYRELIIVRI